MARQDLTSVEHQLRLTVFRLAQLQERHRQTSHITERDVATLITQGDISTARSKVEKLVRDDSLNGVVERLQACCNLLLERLTELGQVTDFDAASPVLEAVCTLTLVASRTEIKDVLILRDMMVQVYGPEFFQLVQQTYTSRSSSQIVEALDKRPPPAVQVDVYMASIAKEYDLSWTPPMLPHQKAHALSEMLDQTGFPRTINAQELREICSRGIPPQPLWLRPRIWKLLLGTLSHHKDTWEVEAYSKRQSYYDLARSLLSRLSTQPPPTMPLSPMDTALWNLVKALSNPPPELGSEIEASPLCPFHDNAPEGIRIENADAVEERLKLIRAHMHEVGSSNETPEIHLDSADSPSSQDSPQISESSLVDSPSDGHLRKAPRTILHTSAAKRNYVTSLNRLIYIHMSLHPSTPTTYLASVIVPLYMVMIQEIDISVLAHVEADTFWLLTELWGEVGEIAEDEGSRAWVAKFGRRLAWADPELAGDLARKGLDPSLPHYSYRWLVPLLTRTLPFASVLTIWDALFAQSQRTSEHNAKLEFLLDICTSMLINARVRVFRLGRPAAKSPGLWEDIDVTVATSSGTHTGLEEVFIQGMALLQNYPMEELGGPERVIDIALGLANRRKDAEKKVVAAPGLGERLRGTMWSSFMAKSAPAEPPITESDKESDGTPSPEWPDSGAEDEGDTTEKPSSALLGRLKSTVWRGITNQSSMDVPPSPLQPPFPALPLSTDSKSVETTSPNTAVRIGSRVGNSIWRGITNQTAMEAPPSPTLPMSPLARSDGSSNVSPTPSASFWGFTGKSRESNAVASSSKSTTNWSAKASTLWTRSPPSSAISSPALPSHHFRTNSLGTLGRSWTNISPKRGSLPTQYDNEYSPPPRPHFRDSKFQLSKEDSSALDAASSNLLAKGKSALASLTGAATNKTPKVGPRPLLLNSSSLITSSKPRYPSRSPTPVAQLRDSLSSTSSAVLRSSDQDSESGSGRFVPFRISPSPRPPRSPRIDVAQLTGNDEGDVQHADSSAELESLRKSSSSVYPQHHEGRTIGGDSGRHGWSQVELPDSPSTLPSSPPPRTPVTVTNRTGVRVSEESERRGTMVVNELHGVDHPHSVDRRSGRKKSWSAASVSPASSLEDSSASQDNALSLRKRYGQRPTNLRSKSSGDLNTLVSDSMPEMTANTPRATDFAGPASSEQFIRAERNSRSPRPGRVTRKFDLLAKDNYPSSDGDDEGYDDFLSAYGSEGVAVTDDA